MTHQLEWHDDEAREAWFQRHPDVARKPVAETEYVLATLMPPAVDEDRRTELAA